MAESFRLFLFGGFRLERVGPDSQAEKPLVLYSHKVESLFAYLVLYPTEHSREKLAALYWGESGDQQARQSLRTGLSSIRKQLGETALLADRDTVQLNPTLNLWVDARQSAEISSLYTGALLADFYDDWISPLRDEYRALYLAALLERVEQLRTQSEYAAAILDAQQVLATDRANEPAHQHLMFCYAALGNRNAVLQQYEECKRALREELAVEPAPATRALYESIRTGITTQSPAARLTNLPRPTTSFVGREQETEELCARLAPNATRAALVTLTGAGGSGKTRLAVEVGQQLVSKFANGVWWVDLTALVDFALVPNQVAKALGVQEQPNVPLDETLLDRLRAQELLLVLDNCEHLLDGCARLVGRIFGACPNVAVLATSREALNLTGEEIYPVAPLSLPRQSLAALARVALEFPAIRLFVERARFANPHFTFDEANALTVINICQRLDGIPLAIELAAARVKVLTVAQIAVRLDDRFSLLTGGSRTALPRQQTLRALIDWSYELLNEEEQKLFACLSVFAGGWTLEACQAIARLTQQTSPDTPNPDTAGLLFHLVEKSLVLVDTSGADARYTMLETIREYARERLWAQDPENAIQERHLVFFTALAEYAHHPAWEAQNKAHAAQLESEHNNLRAALEFALTTRNIQMALRLSGALGMFWYNQSHAQEGEVWYRRVLELAAERGAPELRARVLSNAGTLKWSRAEFVESKRLHRQALELYHKINDLHGIAFSLNNVAIQHAHLGELDTANNLTEEGLAFAQATQDRNLEILLLGNLATGYWEEGQERTRAKPILERALALARQTASHLHALIATNLGELEGSLGNHTQALGYLDEALFQLEQHYEPLLLGNAEREKGVILTALGDSVSARVWFERSLHTYQKNDSHFEFATTLAHLAVIEARTGETHRAVQFAAYALKEIQETLASHLIPSDRATFELLVAQLRETLGEAAFEQAWAKGRTLSRDDVLAMIFSSS